MREIHLWLQKVLTVYFEDTLVDDFTQKQIIFILAELYYYFCVRDALINDILKINLTILEIFFPDPFNILLRFTFSKCQIFSTSLTSLFVNKILYKNSNLLKSNFEVHRL